MKPSDFLTREDRQRMIHLSEKIANARTVREVEEYDFEMKCILKKARIRYEVAKEMEKTKNETVAAL